MHERESFLDDLQVLVETAILYGEVKSVGRMMVARIEPDERNPGAQMAVLQLSNQRKNEKRWMVHNLPPEKIMSKQWVEILVRLSWVRVFPIMWMTAIRPYLPETFGKPVSSFDKTLLRIFAANRANQKGSPEFFERYILPFCEQNTTMWS